jgi:glycine oxidase
LSAFLGNLPRIVANNRKVSIDGLYRHGFRPTPALAGTTLAYAQRGFIHMR